MSVTTIPGAGIAGPAIGSNGHSVVPAATLDLNYVLPSRDTWPRPTPDSDPYNCEYLDGQWVIKPMSTESGISTSRILGRLIIYLEHNRIGEAAVDCLYPTPRRTDKTRSRKPDVAFVSAERWPLAKRHPRTDPWPVVPDLVVEVLSPTNSAVGMQEKLAEYFAAGVRQVWIVSPDQRRIEVHSSLAEMRAFNGSETLDAEPVLPGFRLALDDVFGRPDAADQST